MTSPTPAFRPYRYKTLAAWLSFIGGPFGLHRFYLYGWTDLWGWMHPLPTVLGLWGLQRLQSQGVDDPLIWWLLPLLGFQIAQTCLTAILLALQTPAQWNGRHNPSLPADAQPGQTSWMTVGAIVCALLVGAVALMSGIAVGFQRYVESEMKAGQQKVR